jgi:phosphoesterase RecJ-like protein
MMDGKLIFSALRRKDLDFYQVDPKNLDGIVQQLRVTRGVETAVFLYEVAPNRYKVSLRSNGKVNVSKVASYFQGGGHFRAAGCTMDGDVHDVVNNIAAQVDRQLRTCLEII